jgi:DNA-binding CsgD family transcriptional regulator/tetratricopeptide (TPR) repeat protein
MTATRLFGRRQECNALDRLLASAQEGQSGVLVLRGEPGVGKTALLDYVLESASGFQVARAAGVESEVELAFAALQQLCAPMTGELDRLPAPQRDALDVAFGLKAGDPPERFLVGLAVLSLLSATAEEQPLLCVIDDAQWLDRASEQALAFVARRLLADPVAIVFATRAHNGELAGLPELVVEGLAREDARTLLASTIKAPPLDERVRDRIVAETRGNPLALLELPRGLTPAELAVGFGLHPALPLSGRIEESFQLRAEELPVDTQRLLLVASADQLGDPIMVSRAAEQLGVGPDAVAPATDAELLDVGADVRFRHPLVRSAVYRAAPLEERRAAHRALAAVTDLELDPDRRAWHLAAAAAGPDEEVASELERSAGRAQERGGLAAAAVFLERSAELTPDPQLQALRRLSAAGADLAAGANGRAQALLDQSVPHLVEPGARAQALRMEGVIRFADGRGGDTPSLFFDAAMALRDVDAGLARETLLEAFEAAMWAGRLTSGTTTTDVANAALTIPAPEDDRETASLILTGYTERLTAGYPRGVEGWRRGAGVALGEVAGEANLQTLGMLWNATGELFDFEAHSAAARRRVRLAREQGALVTMPVALSCLAWTELLSGRIETAEALVAEAVELATATGIPSMPGAQGMMTLGMLAWRGRDDEAKRVAEAVNAEAFARGQGLGITLAQFCLTTLELGHGRYEEARIAALNVFEEDPLYIGSIALADMVEATVRSGDRDAAEAALARLTERALATGTPWALGLLSRARALLAADAEAEAHYQAALDHLGRSGVVTDFARARLLYGEWLRRQRRRRDARLQLRVAHDMLQATGGGAFAHRASVELLATGEHARTRVTETRDQLTPQEQQVAQLAAGGESNAEIAAQLFISPHTVAYHLRKVFSKLGVTSRNQLPGAIGEQLEAAAPAG